MRKSFKSIVSMVLMVCSLVGLVITAPSSYDPGL